MLGHAHRIAHGHWPRDIRVHRLGLFVEQFLPLLNLVRVLLDELLLAGQLVLQVGVLFGQQKFWLQGGQQESLLQEEDVDLAGQVEEVHRGLLHLQLNHVVVVPLRVLFGEDVQAMLQEDIESGL